VIGLLYAAFGILRQATNIFLEGVPNGVDLDEITKHILLNKNVKLVKDLYVWAISSNEYVLCFTVVLKVTDYKQLQTTTDTLKQELQEKGFAKVIIEVT
jgi:cobalt-zinc-cadmium efflux system protein